MIHRDQLPCKRDAVLQTELALKREVGGDGTCPKRRGSTCTFHLLSVFLWPARQLNLPSLLSPRQAAG